MTKMLLALLLLLLLLLSLHRGPVNHALLLPLQQLLTVVSAMLWGHCSLTVTVAVCAKQVLMTQ
jgi:hypothetical protein